MIKAKIHIQKFILVNLKRNRMNKQKLTTNSCMLCEKEFEGEEPKMCCSGRECGCLGMPIDPIVCSDECYLKLINKNKNSETITINNNIYRIKYQATKIGDRVVVKSNNNNVNPFIYKASIDDADDLNWIIIENLYFSVITKINQKITNV